MPKGAVYADIGAGTGKLTVKLAEHEYTVFAVEPNADMRKQLAVTLAPFSNVKIIDGTAETQHSLIIVLIFSLLLMLCTGLIWMCSAQNVAASSNPVD